MTSATRRPLPTTGLWNIDEIHSSVAFRITHHSVSSFRASFAPVTGFYDAAAGVLEGEVRADSLLLPTSERLRGHLMEPRFLDADANPTISFRSTAITSDDDGRLQLHGDLTLRGTTNPVRGQGSLGGLATVHQQPGDKVSERLGIDVTAVIDRRDFGMTWNNDIGGGIFNLGWDVSIEVSLELIAPAGTI
jgi:polyisoprenoid-binding protein YceI